MGGVIVNNDDDDWFVANHEYRQLLARARRDVDREDDKQAFVEAEALQGLFLESFPDEQARRLATALRVPSRSFAGSRRRHAIPATRSSDDTWSRWRICLIASSVDDSDCQPPAAQVAKRASATISRLRGPIRASAADQRQMPTSQGLRRPRPRVRATRTRRSPRSRGR